jgi:protein-tyrosine phosphatase
VRFLDKKHGENWAIWEFRAEGTGYPDSEVYGRIHHFPFPDHHPPPFALIPAMMASMRNWLKEDTSDVNKQHQRHGSALSISSSKEKRKVAVVHCKAGKGRSGTVSCSYLISQEGWTMEDALKRFTERRMRAGFGEGVSIPSQLRWIGYVNTWTNSMNKTYVERPVEILEVHVWGLRDGVKIAVEGYVDEGRKIKCFHLFKRRERIVVDEGNDKSDSNSRAGSSKETLRKKVASASSLSSSSIYQPALATETVTSPESSGDLREDTAQLSAAILRPEKPVILPTSDVNIDFERRTKAAYTGWAMVTSIAHVWFNAFFEGGNEHDSGIFECEWDKLDGIKGTSRKGARALERVKVVWRYPSKAQLEGEGPVEQPGPQDIHEIPGQVMTLPKPGEPVHESHAADWRGDNVVRESRDEQECVENYSADNPTSSPLSSGEITRQDDSARQIIGHQNIVPDEATGIKGSRHTLATEASVAAASAITSAANKVSHLGRELGLRQQTDTSKDVSLASSVEDLSQSQKATKQEAESSPLQKQDLKEDEDHDSEIEGVKPFYENGNVNRKGKSDS